MNDDSTLLRRYAEDGSEAAFAELVGRHVNLVYGAALRRTGGDAHWAADVSQRVFTALARDARRLSRHSVLPAWLHTATRNAALNLVISERRRKAREQEAANMMPQDASVESPQWERIKPVLDDAIDELPEADRAAVVLRFLERREFSEVGLALKVSSDAARMRTERALDKLRMLLARRGVTSTASALGVVVASQPLVSAPAGMASALASSSLAATGGSALATSLITPMTTKIVTSAVISGILALGLGTYIGRASLNASLQRAAVDNSAQVQENAALRRSNAGLQADIDRLNAANGRLNAANAELTENNTQLAAKAAGPAAPRKNLSIGMTPRELKQNILNNLRQVDAARTQYKIEKSADPSSVDELVGDSGYIRRLQTVGGEDYSGLSMGAGQILSVTTPDGTTVTYDPSGAETTQITEPMSEAERAQAMMQSVGPAVQQAVNAYRAANQGQNPPSAEALTPFFTNPQDAAAFAQAREAVKAAQSPPH